MEVISWPFLRSFDFTPPTQARQRHARVASLLPAPLLPYRPRNQSRATPSMAIIFCPKYYPVDSGDKGIGSEIYRIKGVGLPGLATDLNQRTMTGHRIGRRCP